MKTIIKKDVELKDYLNLTDYINWEDCTLINKQLQVVSNFNVLYDQGRFFNLAIASNNVKIFQLLLTYFKENQLSKYEVGSGEYNDLYSEFTEILENAADGIELSKEMKEVLAPYIDDRLNDSFLDEITIPFENETLNRATEEEINLAGNSDPVIHHNSEVISH